MGEEIIHNIAKGEGISQAIQAELVNKKVIQEGQKLGASIWDDILTTLNEEDTIQHKNNTRKIGDEWKQRWSNVKTYIGDVVTISKTTWEKIVAIVKKGLGTTNNKPANVEKPEPAAGEKQDLTYAGFKESQSNIKLDKDKTQGISKSSTQDVYIDDAGHQRVVIKDKHGDPYRVSEYAPDGKLMYEGEIKNGKLTKTKGYYEFIYQPTSNNKTISDFSKSPARIYEPASENGKKIEWVFDANGKIHPSSGLRDGSVEQPEMDAYAGSETFQKLEKPVEEKTKTENGITYEYDSEDHLICTTNETAENKVTGMKKGKVTIYKGENGTNQRTIYKDDKGIIYRIIEYNNGTQLCQKNLGDDGNWSYNNNDIRFIYYFPNVENPDRQIKPRMCIETLIHKTNNAGKTVAATKRVTYYTEEGTVKKVEEVICDEDGYCKAETTASGKHI